MLLEGMLKMPCVPKGAKRQPPMLEFTFLFLFLLVLGLYTTKKHGLLR